VANVIWPSIGTKSGRYNGYVDCTAVVVIEEILRRTTMKMDVHASLWALCNVSKARERFEVVQCDNGHHCNVQVTGSTTLFTEIDTLIRQRFYCGFAKVSSEDESGL
jgi:hypothetical protein